jgi:hypothetical protein
MKYMNDESGGQSRCDDVIVSWGITERINSTPQTHVLTISGELADSALPSHSCDRNLGPKLVLPVRVDRRSNSHNQLGGKSGSI